MVRLIVNPGTGSAWEIPLQPGVTSLGRGPDNNYPIEHASVSSAHCQLTVTASGVVVKDLGSINGTFVNDVMVDEARLSNGQTLRLGDVVMRFESDQIPLAPPIRSAVSSGRGAAGGMPSPPDKPTAAVCKFHPHIIAQFLCPKCGKTFCNFCVNLRQGRNFCRACGVECSPLERAPVSPAPNKSFFSLATGALGYPFKGDGLTLLICGVVFFLVLGFAKTLLGVLGPYAFVLVIMIEIFGMGYVFSYAKSIITATANGEDAPPDWPEITEWQADIARPFCQMVGLLALTFGPTAVLRWWQPGTETFAHGITIAAAVLGALMAPMGMLALAMFDSLGALNPFLLVTSMLRIPLQYFAAAAVFELLTAVYFLAGDTIGLLIPIPILPGIISVFLNLYLTLAGMRILGLLYRIKADQLGWFAKE